VLLPRKYNFRRTSLRRWYEDQGAYVMNTSYMLHR